MAILAGLNDHRLVRVAACRVPALGKRLGDSVNVSIQFGTPTHGRTGMIVPGK